MVRAVRSRYLTALLVVLVAGYVVVVPSVDDEPEIDGWRSLPGAGLPGA